MDSIPTSQLLPTTIWNILYIVFYLRTARLDTQRSSQIPTTALACETTNTAAFSLESIASLSELIPLLEQARRLQVLLAPHQDSKPSLASTVLPRQAAVHSHFAVVQQHPVHLLDGSFCSLLCLEVHEPIALGAVLITHHLLKRSSVSSQSGGSAGEGLCGTAPSH